MLVRLHLVILYAVLVTLPQEKYSCAGKSAEEIYQDVAWFWGLREQIVYTKFVFPEVMEVEQ